MNCPTGKPGTPAYAMSAEESLSNMARLSLCGKLNLAIEKCNLYPFLIPYYGSKEFMTERPALAEHRQVYRILMLSGSRTTKGIFHMQNMPKIRKGISPCLREIS